MGTCQPLCPHEMGLGEKSMVTAGLGGWLLSPEPPFFLNVCCLHKQLSDASPKARRHHEGKSQECVVLPCSPAPALPPESPQHPLQAFLHMLLIPQESWRSWGKWPQLVTPHMLT